MTDDPLSRKNPPRRDDDETGVAGLWQRLKTGLRTGPDASLRESLEGVIDQHGLADQDLSPEERSMLRNILSFGDVRVVDVMVPRADIVAVDETISMGELMQIFREAGHSRLPVYRRSLDDLAGMVHIKDLVGWLTDVKRAKPGRSDKSANPGNSARSTKAAEITGDGGKTAAVPDGETNGGTGSDAGNGHGVGGPGGGSDSPGGGVTLRGARDLRKPLSELDLIRKVLFVPPSMPAVDLLVKMQSTRNHLAIVVDEYGGTDGLVSIEDLVEEIVGEIEDEHDSDDGAMIETQENGSLIADARAPVAELESLLDFDLFGDDVDEDIDTLGGLVFSLVGRVPVRGEIIRHSGGIEFEILEADPRRIRRLRVHRRRDAKAPPAHEARKPAAE